MKDNTTITLIFNSVEVRKRAEYALVGHGVCTTSDPINSVLRFQNLDRDTAMKIHRVLMTMGIEYNARIRG